MEEANIQRFPVLRSVYGGLTKSERRIADYIANHAGVVMEQTVATWRRRRKVQKSPFHGFVRN